MLFTFNHFNFNVLDLDKSLNFYRDALNLHEVHRKEREGFILVYLGDGASGLELELTWLRDRTEPYDLGENEFHLAVTVHDFEAALKMHKEMGVVCYENNDMGIYFIADPDGYWIEVVPEK